MATLTMYEYFIQRKEVENFAMFSLLDVERVFDKVELVSFNEHRKIRSTLLEDDLETEVVLSAHPNGGSIGGACWKIEYNKQMIVYAIDLNDVSLNVTVPMMRYSDFKNANILISNGYHKTQVQVVRPKNSGSGLVSASIKPYKYLSEDKLRLKLEKVLVDNGG